MKRRILVLLLALCLLAGLISGCGQPAAETSEPPAEDTAPATEPAAGGDHARNTRVHGLDGPDGDGAI